MKKESETTLRSSTGFVRPLRFKDPSEGKVRSIDHNAVEHGDDNSGTVSKNGELQNSCPTVRLFQESDWLSLANAWHVLGELRHMRPFCVHWDDICSGDL